MALLGQNLSSGVRFILSFANPIPEWTFPPHVAFFICDVFSSEQFSGFQVASPHRFTPFTEKGSLNGFLG